MLPYYFAYKAQHFFNESLLASSKYVVISECVLKPSIFEQENKITSNFLLQNSSWSSSSFFIGFQWLLHLLKLVLNNEWIILPTKQIICHHSFWAKCWCLVTRRIFEHVLDPRWRFVYGHFYTVILCLSRTYIFRRRLPNLLVELWELFYHSYFDKQGLNFTRFDS